MAKAASWTGIDAEARKPGEQTGLDTPVVLALNDECLLLRVSLPAQPGLTLEPSLRGIWIARLKLKGIDGDPHKRWSMWFNTSIRVEPHPGLTCAGKLYESRALSSEIGTQVLHGCRQLVS